MATPTVRPITWEVQPDNCWNCTSHKINIQHGAIKIGSKGIKLQRYLYKGIVPEGKGVFTSCNNNLCCNPKHFVLKDLGKNGNQPSGTQHHSAKLDEKKVAFIKEHPELSNSVLSHKFKVNASSIQRVRNGRNWKV